MPRRRRHDFRVSLHSSGTPGDHARARQRVLAVLRGLAADLGGASPAANALDVPTRDPFNPGGSLAATIRRSDP